MIAMLAALLAVVTAPYAPVSYACDGSTAAYTVSFPYLSSSDLTTTSTTAGGAVTNLVLAVDYTLNVSSTQSTATLTLFSPATTCPSGNTLRIARTMSCTQPTSFRQQLNFNPGLVETATDRVLMCAQQVSSNVVNPVLPSALTNSTPVTARGETAALQLQDWFAMEPSLRGYGALGDGVTDDTSAIQTALNSANIVRCSSGDTYLVNGGLTSSIVGQVVSFYGCSIKLKNSAGSHGILTMSGAGSHVIGGTWDLNVANNSSGDPFGHFSVLVNADREVVEGLYVKNSFGLGIKGAAGVSYADVRFNRTENTATAGIYFDGSAIADAVGNSIHHNQVDISGNTASAVGIYIASASPYTFVQRKWKISDNEVVGPPGTSTSVPITGRGMDGQVQNNQVIGGDIGISVDISAADESTIVSGNRVQAVSASATGYGIEVNGAKALVTGNIVKGGKIGYIGSSTGAPSTSMDWQQIVGNQFVEQTVNAVQILPGGGHTAQHTNIVGNTIISTLTAQAGAIRLAGDCRFSLISGNQIKGPGSGTANGTAVYLDTVNSDVSIFGNRIAGWISPVVLFNAGAVAQTQITFNGNDMSEDSPSDGSWIAVAGSATLGARITQAWNISASNTAMSRNWIDRATSLIVMWSNSFATPEANVTASPGSLYLSTIGGGATLFTKATGSGTTGWIGAVTGVIVLAAGTGTATVRSGASCTCTDTTANVSVKCAVATTTLTATGTGTDTISYTCF